MAQQCQNAAAARVVSRVASLDRDASLKREPAVWLIDQRLA